MQVQSDYNKQETNTPMLNTTTYRTLRFNSGSVCNDGFTLIELMIAMVVSLFIMISVFSAYSTQRKMYDAQDAIAEMQQNLRYAVTVMGRELRMAGYNASQNCKNTGITAATATSVSFTYCVDDDNEDNNGDGVVDEDGESKQITYDLYDAYADGVNDIGRQVGALKRALAENIEGLEFIYKDGNNNLTGTLKDIRSIEISILARSDRVDLGYTDTTNYTTPSGGGWAAYNDNIRRRLLTTTVQCRNMGL